MMEGKQATEDWEKEEKQEMEKKDNKIDNYTNGKKKTKNIVKNKYIRK